MSMECISYKETNGYFIPTLTVLERTGSTARWDRMQLNYPKEHRPIIFLCFYFLENTRTPCGCQ